MHLIPADRADQRIIDGEQVCEAIAALGDPASVRTLAQHFAVLADPTRLMLLICIRAAGPISVSDLAVDDALVCAVGRDEVHGPSLPLVKI